MQIEEFKRLRKNTLYGFLNVRLSNGLLLIDCPVHRHPNGRAWVGLPSKPRVESGRHVADPTSGKPLYLPVCQWRNCDINERWSDAVIKLLLAAYPDALGD